MEEEAAHQVLWACPTVHLNANRPFHETRVHDCSHLRLGGSEPRPRRPPPCRQWLALASTEDEEACYGAARRRRAPIRSDPRGTRQILDER